MKPRASRSGTQPIWTPGAVVVLVISIGLGIVAPLSVAVAEHRNLAADRVDIVIRGLPTGVSAPLTVAGISAAPFTTKIVQRQAVALTGSGPYRVLASPVKIPAGTYFAAESAVPVRAQNGSTATAVVNYTDFIASSTKVLTVPAGDTVSLMDPPQAAGELLVLENNSAPSGLKPGDFLASGPTSGEPDGYLVKVKAQVSAPPGEEEFDVTLATLPDILEKAEINVSSDVTRASRPLLFTTPFRYKASTGVRLSIAVYPFERSFSFQIEWNQQGQRSGRKRLRNYRSATLTAHLGELWVPKTYATRRYS